MRRWIRTRLSFGPLPSPRHSATTWVADDRFFFVYGGYIEQPEDFEKDSVYRLDTRPPCPCPPSVVCSLTPLRLHDLDAHHHHGRGAPRH